VSARRGTSTRNRRISRFRLITMSSAILTTLALSWGGGADVAESDSVRLAALVEEPRAAEVPVDPGGVRSPDALLVAMREATDDAAQTGQSHEVRADRQQVSRGVEARTAAGPALSSVEIADALSTSRRRIEARWPRIQRALDAEGLDSVHSQIAAVATIVTEVGPDLQPIAEHGDRSYFRQMYDWRRDLGNIRPGDGARYHGRGYIQLTGRANYRAYGRHLGLPLEDRPQLALRPGVGARVLAAYFKARGIDRHARRGEWRSVRYGVNGGFNGWERFRPVVTSLQRSVRQAR
jgi:hypothetical protein